MMHFINDFHFLKGNDVYEEVFCFTYRGFIIIDWLFLFIKSGHAKRECQWVFRNL